MNNRLANKLFSRLLSCICQHCHAALTAIFLFISCAPSAHATGQYPGDEGKYGGDHIKLRVTTSKVFKEVDSGNVRCAPAGSIFFINRQEEKDIFLRLYDTDERIAKKDDAKCPQPAEQVREFRQYKITQTDLEKIDFRRTGVMFGALVVPFKFRLGDAKEIVSSQTIAPYVGFRTGWGANFGLTFTPLLSAGLGLVPLTDPASKQTVTRNAFSISGGFILSSVKNDSFHAGLLVGRDYLGKLDRDLDPRANKTWVSLYLGYSVSQ